MNTRWSANRVPELAFMALVLSIAGFLAYGIYKATQPQLNLLHSMDLQLEPPQTEQIPQAMPPAFTQPQNPVNPTLPSQVTPDVQPVPVQAPPVVQGCENPTYRFHAWEVWWNYSRFGLATVQPCPGYEQEFAQFMQ